MKSSLAAGFTSLSSYLGTKTGKLHAGFAVAAATAFLAYSILQLIVCINSYAAPSVATAFVPSPAEGMPSPGWAVCLDDGKNIIGPKFYDTDTSCTIKSTIGTGGTSDTINTPFKTPFGSLQPNFAVGTRASGANSLKVLPAGQQAGAVAFATNGITSGSFGPQTKANPLDSVYIADRGAIYGKCVYMTPNAVNFTKTTIQSIAFLYAYARCGWMTGPFSSSCWGGACPVCPPNNPYLGDFGYQLMFGLWTETNAQGQPIVPKVQTISALARNDITFTQTKTVPLKGTPYRTYTLSVSTAIDPYSYVGWTLGNSLFLTPSALGETVITEFITFPWGALLGVIAAIGSSIASAYFAFVGAGPYQKYGVLQTILLPKLAPEEVPSDLSPEATNASDVKPQQMSPSEPQQQFGVQLMEDLPRSV